MRLDRGKVCVACYSTGVGEIKPETMNIDGRKASHAVPSRFSLFLLIVLLMPVFAAGGVFAYRACRKVDEAMREDLLTQARMVAQDSRYRRVANLTGSAADIETPTYQRIKEQLMAVRAGNPRCRFLYLVGKRGTELFFYADSEPADSKDYSPPGQVYVEAPDALRGAFDGIESVTGPYTDRWGTWITAMTPIRQPESGEVLAVFCMDVNARDWAKNVYLEGLPSILVVLLFSTVLVFLFLLLRRSHSAVRRISVSEAALRESSERFEALIDHVQTGILLIDPVDHSIVVANRKAAEMCGVSPADMIGKVCHQYVCPAPPGECPITDLRQALDNVERILLAADGRKIPIVKTAVPVNINGQDLLLESFVDISERKRVEEELKTSGSVLTASLESTADGILIVNLDGRIAQWNRKFAELWRIPDEILAKKDDDTAIDYVLSQLEAPDQFVSKVRELYSHPDQSSFDVLLFRDGRMFERYSQPQKIGDDVVGRVWSFRDVTERKRAEGALRESEARHRSIIETTAEWIWEMDLTGTHTFTNPGVTDILGYAPEEVIGQSVLSLMHPEDSAAVKAALPRLIAEKQGWRGWTLRWRHKDGSYRYLESNASPLYDETGSPVGYVGADRDITERMQAQAAQAESERMLRSIVDGSPIPAFIIGTDHRVMYWNKALEQVSGIRAEEIIGTDRQWKAFYASDRPCLADLLVEGRNEDLATWYPGKYKKAELIENAFEATDFFPEMPAGGKWLRFTAAALRDTQGKVIGAIETLEDITERKRAEAERTRLEAQLRQAQKMEAVGQLAGGIAHDFNNLLQVILGNVDIVREGLGRDTVPGKMLDEVRTAAERAADLTRQLLAFGRRQIIQPTNLDLNELIQSVLNMIRRVIGEHIELSFIPGVRLGTVHADQGQIEQVLMNLCVNARDAMPNGGALTIETENVVVSSEYCREHPWAIEGRYALLSVTDTGHGMDEATRAQIFEPFFTTKKVGHGTGLGLATVYGIVKQHNGLIHVYSEPDKGTTFKVYLPIVERPAEAVGSKVETHAAGGNETILVAEDEPLVRDLVSHILRAAGYTVLAARDGEDALRVVAEHGEHIDMALLDVVMPKLGGREVMDYIHAKYPRVRFLFSSGYSENAIHTNFVIKKGLHLITKPYRRPELLRAIREILDESPPA